MRWPRRLPSSADVEKFTRERRAHANAEMERRGLDVPDPRDLLPANWQTLHESYKRVLYVESWATLGANIAYFSDRTRDPKWVQDPLPLPEFSPTFRAAAGWCAPENVSFELRE